MPDGTVLVSLVVWRGGLDLPCRAFGARTKRMKAPLMTEQGTHKALEEWWATAKSDRNRWNATPMGKAIKRLVKEVGNWKNAPRGAPQSAGRVSASKRKGASPFG